jgi:hypothetical protein
MDWSQQQWPNFMEISREFWELLDVKRCISAFNDDGLALNPGTRAQFL